MIYLDTSAMLKLVFGEDESAALRQWLGTDQGDAPLTSSDLTRVEVMRACHRVDVAHIPLAQTVLAQLDLVPLDRALLDAAADLPARHLRSLDALHLATAMSLGEALDVFVVYDARLREAAQDVGLPVASPT